MTLQLLRFGLRLFIIILFRELHQGAILHHTKYVQPARAEGLYILYSQTLLNI
jgi:hypothetical protein